MTAITSTTLAIVIVVCGVMVLALHHDDAWAGEQADPKEH